MEKRNSEIEELITENESLKKEVERLQALENYYQNAIEKCHKMHDEWRHVIFQAREARSNYITLSQEIAKAKAKEDIE